MRSLENSLDWKDIVWFLLIAFGLAWLLDLSTWLNGGLTRAHGLPFGLLTLLRNFTPAIAVIVVTRWISPLPRTRLKTGLRWGRRVAVGAFTGSSHCFSSPSCFM